MLFFKMHHVNEGLPMTLKKNRDFIRYVTFAPPEIQGTSQANWIPLPNILNSLGAGLKLDGFKGCHLFFLEGGIFFF